MTKYRAAGAIALAVAALVMACAEKVERFCDEATQCTEIDTPYCDLNGEFPASEGVGNTCIPTPQMGLEIELTGSGDGVVASTPSGIECGAMCNVSFDIDSQVTLTATPSEDSVFMSWGEACEAEASNVCTLVLGQPATATAEFCAPKTCDEYCGTLEDGCGEMIECGDNCTFVTTCGGGGVSNRCGCIPVAGTDTWNTGGGGSKWSIGIADAVAQSFVANDTITLRHVRLFGSYTSGVSGNVTLSFYSHTGGDPDAGTLLAQAIVPLAETYFTDTGSMSVAQMDFTLRDLALGFTRGTRYWMVVTSDVDDIYIGYHSDTGADRYTSGVMDFYDGASWTERTGADLTFEINPCAPLIDWP